MPETAELRIIYAPVIHDHLRAIEAKYYGLIRQAIETQLRYEPDARTRNRKPLKQPLIFGETQATWEIRFGPLNRFRVLYRVNREARRVLILAIGQKIGERLVVGLEEIEL